jgi:Na+-translocating ferredoxin:NAD+ oxidoreductase subunit B
MRMPTGDVYRALQRRIDELPVPYPETESGVELRLLRALFTEHEAEVALHLSALGEPVGTIHRRLQHARPPVAIEEDQLAGMLGELTKKGAIHAGITRVGKKRVRTYGLAPLVVGMFEFQVDKLTSEYVRDFHQYLEEGFREAVVGGVSPQLRTVPIRAELSAQRSVAPYEDIRGYIATHPGPFSVMNCVCGQSAELIGEARTTSSTHETCLSIGGSLRGARRISREEVLSILDRAEREGHVLQPQNSQKPGFICCCCRDCCEVLRNARKLPRPADAIPSGYQAAVDAQRCTACRRCIKRCPIDAITVNNGVARIDEARCIGCGLCVTTCPQQAITLVRRQRAPRTPTSNTMMYLGMYAKRRGVLGLLPIALKKLFGRKIYPGASHPRSHRVHASTPSPVRQESANTGASGLRTRIRSVAAAMSKSATCR